MNIGNYEPETRRISVRIPQRNIRITYIMTPWARRRSCLFTTDFARRAGPFARRGLLERIRAG